MNLIVKNEEFLAQSLENPNLFGWPVILENLAGEKQGDVEGEELYCQARHINLLIDMETGSDVSQEQASVTVRLSSVTIGVPVKDWKVYVTDTSGIEYACYVVDDIPDRTFGIVVLKLGLLEESV